MESAQLLADRYQVKSRLNRGVAEVVWRAHDLRLRRDVAIKEIEPRPRNGAGPREARRRALREARSAGRLSHPAIITVHDLVEEAGRLWIVTELVEGLSLRDTVLHVGPLPPRWAAWIGFQLLGALRHAHGLGVFHESLSPATILLTGNRVLLSEFGLASIGRDAGTALALTSAPAFIAPERFQGEVPTAAADLWSFGASLYHAVEGCPPFPGADVVTVLSGMMAAGPRPPVKSGPLWPVLEGLLQRDPARRFTVEQASAVVGELLREAGISVEPHRLPSVPPSAFTT
ncbi:serine/threonine-protein kinase [Sinosporangium siamense]|uniref:non-specific serine/threonine protein kinase n=1 Tax=Sinosporangium siamense TaxID=1367973 RepID=A0A919V6B5_9ACTN|nr:serine/threonine-protein kinase [Sinosporangium siamense]GII93885.1 hypothetical protein Ssi02_41160 [Sinosporangium siamense]